MFRSDPSLAAKPVHWNEAARERALADFVSLSAPLTPHDTITRNGDIVRVWKLEGISFETTSSDVIRDAHESLCSMLASLPGGQATIYQYRLQRHTADRLVDPDGPTFSANFSRAYQDAIGARQMLSRELYIALLYRPYASDTERKLARGGRTKASIEAHAKEALAAMRDRGAMLERSLRQFKPTLLGIRTEETGEYWEAGELFSFLINGYWRKVKVPNGPCSTTLPDGRLSFGAEMLEVKMPRGGKRFAAMLDIKEYASKASPGSLSALLYERCEFIETQSFAVLNRKKATAALTLQRNQLLATDDVVGSQVEAFDEALNDLGDGKFCMGEYSYTLAIFGDTPEQAKMRAASCIGAVSVASKFELVPVDLVPDSAWFSQQPGNHQWRTRKASISSRAFAALACCHNFYSGKRDGNPWGEALAIMATPSGQPLYLNLHVSPDNEDSEDKKLPGNTVIVGQTSSGKTTILSACMTFMAKYKKPPRLISFSLDRDTEFLIRAYGGPFYTFERNVPTGLNPLQRAVTEDRIAHWTALVKRCLISDGLPLLPSDMEAVARAVRTVAAMEPHLRWFSTIRQNLPRQQNANSLHDRFSRWCRGGEYGWVFDMAPDKLGDIHAHRAIGFDYTGVMKNNDVKTPIMMELLNVMEELITGEPLIYHVAEAWKALGDPVFAPFVKEHQKTIRKKNGLGIFDTQEIGDLLNNENGRTMVDQSVTKIVVGSTSPKRSDFIDGLGFTEREFERVQLLGKGGARTFLIKQNQQATVCEFDLSDASFRDYLTILSPSLDNIALLDEIRAEHGDDPDVILPLLCARVRDRLSLKKAA